MSRKPSMTDKVRRGLWIIIARSPTLWSAELNDTDLTKEERELILLAGRYAEAHWSDGTAKWDYSE